MKFAWRVFGLGLCVWVLSLIASCLFYDMSDPAYNIASSKSVHNLLGIYGAKSADIILTWFGIALPIFLIAPLIWGYGFFRLREFIRPYWRLFAFILGNFSFATSLALIIPHINGFKTGGAVGRFFAEQGMNVPPYRPIAELTDPDAIEVEINVPENEISSFSIGDEASVAVPSMNLEGVPAVIVSKGVEADLLSHGYSVRLAVTGRFGILPGMTCKVSFAPQAGAAEVFMVPGRAVSLSNDGRRYVWVVAGDGTVSRKYVDVYSAGPDGVLVSGGLEAGDAVVSDGIQKISEGMKVVVKN